MRSGIDLSQRPRRVVLPPAIAAVVASVVASVVALGSPAALAAAASTPGPTPVVVHDCLDARFPVWDGVGCVASPNQTIDQALPLIPTPTTGAAPNVGGETLLAIGGIALVTAGLRRQQRCEEQVGQHR